MAGWFGGDETFRVRDSPIDARSPGHYMPHAPRAYQRPASRVRARTLVCSAGPTRLCALLNPFARARLWMMTMMSNNVVHAVDTVDGICMGEAKLDARLSHATTAGLRAAASPRRLSTASALACNTFFELSATIVAPTDVLVFGADPTDGRCGLAEGRATIDEAARVATPQEAARSIRA